MKGPGGPDRFEGFDHDGYEEDGAEDDTGERAGGGPDTPGGRPGARSGPAGSVRIPPPRPAAEDGSHWPRGERPMTPEQPGPEATAGPGEPNETPEPTAEPNGSAEAAAGHAAEPDATAEPVIRPSAGPGPTTGQDGSPGPDRAPTANPPVSNPSAGPDGNPATGSPPTASPPAGKPPAGKPPPGAATPHAAASPASPVTASPAAGGFALPPGRQVPSAGPGPLLPAHSHDVLKSLLGAWALAACSSEETAAVEAHLNDCVPCAEEALRLRDAVGLLHHDDNLDLNPLLRSRVLAGCLVRRPARIPVPEWATAYDAEAARLDALLRDMGSAEWRAPVRLKWFDDGERSAERDTTVAGVIGHLMAVDGILATVLGLPDPLGPGAPASPLARTEAIWRAKPVEPLDPDTAPDTGPGQGTGPGVHGGVTGALGGRTTRDRYDRRSPGAIHEPWREQACSLVRSASFAGRGVDERPVPFGDLRMPVRDSFIDRALACWVHGGDIADAVGYPYKPPTSAHLNHMIDLYARRLPETIAERRRAGRAAPPRQLVAAGTPGRSLHLEVEGSGGGHWYIALDSPAALARPDEAVAQITLDRDTFYQLAAGHVPPEDAAAGQVGDPEAIRDVLFATAAMSRL